MEVTVHKVSKQLGPEVRDDGPCVGIGEQMGGKPSGLSSEDEVEHNV